MQLLHDLGRGFRQLDQIRRATAQALSKLAGVLENVRQQTNAVPHALDRRPTPGQHAVARRRRHRLRPLWLETLPFTAQPAIQLRGQAVIGFEQVLDLTRSDSAVHLHPVELARYSFE
ncbi:hypothetical protein D3C78_1476710 [compost metagenome]